MNVWLNLQNKFLLVPKQSENCEKVNTETKRSPARVN